MNTQKRKPKKARIIVFFILILLFLFTASYLFFFNNNNSNKKSNNNNIKEISTVDIYNSISKKENKNNLNSETENDTNSDNEDLDEQPLESKEFSGWIAYWALDDALTTYNNFPNAFVSLSPTWFYVKPDGGLGTKNTLNDKTLINSTNKNKTKLIPSISNSKVQELSNILNDSSKVDEHINNIVNVVETNKYDGIDIDYEHILAEDRDEFTSFIKRLSEKLHKQDKVLTIAILWKQKPAKAIEALSESRAAQDWSELAKYTDEFRIMAYDYTGSTDKAGPIAPINWIEAILEYALDNNVPSEKIVLGLPLYAYEWKKDSNRAKALVWKDVQFIKSNFTVLSDKLDTEKGERHLVFKDQNIVKEVWYQDYEATQLRIELAQKYNVNKFVFWRLGKEDPLIFKNKS